MSEYNSQVQFAWFLDNHGPTVKQQLVVRRHNRSKILPRTIFSNHGSIPCVISATNADGVLEWSIPIRGIESPKVPCWGCDIKTNCPVRRATVPDICRSLQSQKALDLKEEHGNPDILRKQNFGKDPTGNLSRESYGDGPYKVS